MISHAGCWTQDFFLQAKSSSSNLTSLGFSGRKSQDTDHGYSEEQNWIFYFPRGRTSKKGGGGGHVSLFRHVGKMSVLSYQSRSENWGDFLSGRCYSLESNVTVTHYHMVKKISLPLPCRLYWMTSINYKSGLVLWSLKWSFPGGDWPNFFPIRHFRPFGNNIVSSQQVDLIKRCPHFLSSRAFLAELEAFVFAQIPNSAIYPVGGVSTFSSVTPQSPLSLICDSQMLKSLAEELAKCQCEPLCPVIDGFSCAIVHANPFD